MTEVTTRDRDLMRVLYRMGFMTIEQAEACVYGNRNVAQRRLAGLEAEGFLTSFPLSGGRRGQPTKVYFLKCKQAASLSELIGIAVDPRNIPKTEPENMVVARHALEVNTVLAAFLCAAATRGLGFGFVPEYWAGADATKGSPLADEVQSPGGGPGMVRFRRDAVCCITTPRGKGLFEIEYDRGKEAVSSESWRKITVRSKIAVFLQSLKEKRYERYGGPEFFNHPFKVSRLLFITTSKERLSNIVDACQDLETHGLVYMTTMDQVMPETVLGSIWQVPHGGNIEERCLVTHE